MGINVVLLDRHQRAAYFMHISDICAKERTVWYSFIIGAVFLEDTQTFPQSAEGTICFQTTGLLPDTLSVSRNSSSLLFLHNETCPLTPPFTFVHKSNAQLSLNSKMIAARQGGFIILKKKMLHVPGSETAMFSWPQQLWKIYMWFHWSQTRLAHSRTSKHINQAPGILDLFIAHHRWINGILIKIDLGAFKWSPALSVLCLNYEGENIIIWLNWDQWWGKESISVKSQSFSFLSFLSG